MKRTKTVLILLGLFALSHAHAECEANVIGTWQMTHRAPSETAPKTALKTPNWLSFNFDGKMVFSIPNLAKHEFQERAFRYSCEKHTITVYEKPPSTLKVLSISTDVMVVLQKGEIFYFVKKERPSEASFFSSAPDH